MTLLLLCGMQFSIRKLQIVDSKLQIAVRNPQFAQPALLSSRLEACS